jgi:hypothetical protein
MFQADVYVQGLSHAVAAFLHRYHRLMLPIVKILEVIPRAVS